MPENLHRHDWQGESEKTHSNPCAGSCEEMENDASPQDSDEGPVGMDAEFHINKRLAKSPVG